MRWFGNGRRTPLPTHARADVLEVDVQLTRDRQFVVWHGPELDDVRIKGEPDVPCERRRRRINEYAWNELDDESAVADPRQDGSDCCVDLSAVPMHRDRRLMLLETLLDAFPCQAINIELKETVDESDLPKLMSTLAAFPPCPATGRRPPILVSLSEQLLRRFQRNSGTRAKNACRQSVRPAGAGRRARRTRGVENARSRRCRVESGRRYAVRPALRPARA